MSRPALPNQRERILEAAKLRLWHYGFRKTTIEEIAADAGVGKGTVYLYFDSKEDIALAIMAQFKAENLEKARALAHDPQREPLAKLKETLLLPLLSAQERCQQSPAAQEMIVAVRPYVQERLKPFFEQEIALLMAVLEEGNRQGVFDVSDCEQSARRLKTMCAGFLPPYTGAFGPDALRAEVEGIVEMVFVGMRAVPGLK